ncbi:MAG: single-stranded DNA-binding protein [Clostridia bacterium]|nr:single-stranded DNA-binding protein [Clostridia bacterium]MBQ2914340.1 single-stranded DNA-binding protein [Clostridia bacterium]MBQ3042702.1 single-stranded DNA-binding protein [Clostridia bacterium]MBQ4272250.1 single-stranded DNA-binding protein [Clostridia bacterium]MBQ9125531.1 single-stranded DNA-binding protein [Clostridia bacterium]
MNKVFLIGRLTQDPQTQTLDSGTTLCRFSIAVNRTYSRDGETQADFINIVAWNATAQNCGKYLVKGSQVAVSGSIQTGSYERDGVKRQTFDIRADQVEFLSRPNTTGQAPVAAPAKKSIDQLTEVDNGDDDMPF